MDPIQYIGEVTKAILTHGWSLTTLLIALGGLLHVRRVKKKIKQHAPWMFDDDIDPRYLLNQQMIMENQTRIMRQLGVEPCGPSEIATNGHPNSVKSLTGFLQEIRQSPYFYRYLQRRKMFMKQYLIKLGSRKFQAYLVTTIINLLTAYLTWKGEVNIDDTVQGYMPVINLVVQVVATVLYQVVQGRVDKAAAISIRQASDPGEDYH